MSTTRTFSLTLNGDLVTVRGLAPTTTLLDWLRANGRTGTKEGCAEGDCGACSVLLLERNAHGAQTYRAVNACIALLPMFADREVVTVEGLRGACAERPGELHPVQAAMVERYGSQCGYCTPGFVCSMAEAYYRDDVGPPGAPDAWKKGDQLSGNLCRCTGYRPIRDALDDALTERGRRAHNGQDAGDVLRLRLSKHDAPIPALAYESEGQVFHRPTTIDALLALRDADPGLVIVAGATEIGVELNKKMRPFPRLVSTEAIEELRTIERVTLPADGFESAHGTRTQGFRVHGAATLTALEEALEVKGGSAIPPLTKMLLVFASRQIRSRATLAGNLVTASPIGDTAPVLLALDATITLRSGARGSRTIALADFFLAYRKTAMAPDEIVASIQIPCPAPGEKTASFKVSKRRELDISIVAAAFAIAVDPRGAITSARLAYGGVAATPARARRTEALLVGRAWDDATLDAALSMLEAEFSPIRDVRSGPEFRRGLIPSLFEKFWRGDESLSQDAFPDYVSGEATAPRAASRDLKHESAVGHVTGDAIYVDDQGARRRDALTLWPVLSNVAHGRLVSVDTTEAAKMPGVACVLTARDVPGVNDIGAIRRDETLYADGEVLYHGHPVAVVVGETREICKAAAAKVKVVVEELPAILGIRAAIAAGSFHTNPHVVRRGDTDKAFRDAPHVVEGEIDIGGQEHFYLESQAAWAEAGDDDDVFVCASTQHPSEVQAVISHVLHLPRHKVVVEAPRMGGGFGGKETQGNGWAAHVAIAARKTGRLVRVQLDRDLDMAITGKRHPFYATYKLAFDDDGMFLAYEAHLVSDGGWAADLSESICDRAVFHSDNAYYLPNVHVTGRVAKTHVTSHTAYRGFGGPQGMVVLEEAIERAARSLAMEPEVVRARNLYRGTGESATTHYGQPLDPENRGDIRIGKIWQGLLASSDLAQRRADIRAFNATHRRIKRGIAMTPVKFGISFTASFLNQAGALVVVYRDGTVQVNHGGTEMGQGLYTKMQGVAMRELGLPASRVRVMKTRTDKVPNTSATAASSGADLNGAAVRNACATIRERVAPVAAEMLSKGRGLPLPADSVFFEDGECYAPDRPEVRVAFGDVVEQAYLRQVPLSVTGFYRTPGLAYDKARGRGRPFLYFAYGAAVSEVEVDGYSGMKRVIRVDILHDVGDSLNPNIDRGQVEGAFVQGMGWLTGEELLWDAKGRLLTHSASTYQIPSIGDAPLDFRIALLPDAAQSGTIHGSKAVGEPPFMLAISVREAIKDAIAAFETARDVMHERVGCPATHESIFATIAAIAVRERQWSDAARSAAE